MIESTPLLSLMVQLINVKLPDEMIPPLIELMIVKSFKTRPFVLDNIGEVLFPSRTALFSPLIVIAFLILI